MYYSQTIFDYLGCQVPRVTCRKLAITKKIRNIHFLELLFMSAVMTVSNLLPIKQKNCF